MHVYILWIRNRMDPDPAYYILANIYETILLV